MKNFLKLIFLATLCFACAAEDDAFDATGTFEAVEVVVASEVSGSIEALNAVEGTDVKAGALLGWIDSTQLHLKKKQLVAQIDAILSRRPQIATQLAAWRVQLEAAQRESARAENLFKAGAATQKQLDDARSHLAMVRRQMQAQQSSLDISSQGLISETMPLATQIEQLEDQLRKCRIVNPVSGTILTRYAEVHELAVAGKPLYKVADMSTLTLRAYVTGNQLPLVRLNQDVVVLVDNGTGGFNEYPGAVSWISSKAEFTPKTIQTRDERADLVYAMKVRVKNDGYLKIGMYGEVRF